MSDGSKGLALMDSGGVNARILAKRENRADFRRVEAASIKRMTALSSAEAKRLFARCFYSYQASVYFISQMGRTKLPLAVVEAIEGQMREQLVAATEAIDEGIVKCAGMMAEHHIESPATYSTMTLTEEVAITSSLGRRYFELIHKLDQAMPLLQTLEIEEVISERSVEKERSKWKRLVLALSTTARNNAARVRRAMNEADKAKVDPRAAREGESGARAVGSPVAGSEPTGMPEQAGVDSAGTGGEVTGGQALAPDVVRAGEEGMPNAALANEGEKAEAIEE